MSLLLVMKWEGYNVSMDITCPADIDGYSEKLVPYFARHQWLRRHHSSCLTFYQVNLIVLDTPCLISLEKQVTNQFQTLTGVSASVAFSDVHIKLEKKKIQEPKRDGTCSSHYYLWISTPDLTSLMPSLVLRRTSKNRCNRPTDIKDVVSQDAEQNAKSWNRSRVQAGGGMLGQSESKGRSKGNMRGISGNLGRGDNTMSLGVGAWISSNAGSPLFEQNVAGT
ncbi:hypothetical protein NC652_038981 [Populus alba x Populus x berolinensis]|nr:hypothetical protein NC652_038981 [Populus alba x Populus x berolinensis]